MGFGDGKEERGGKKDLTVQFFRPLGNSALTQLGRSDIEQILTFFVWKLKKVENGSIWFFFFFLTIPSVR